MSANVPAPLSPSVPRPAELDALVARVDRLSEAELNALPLGMIQLDAHGRILKFNQTEGRLARRDPEKQLGRSFFEEVAPCTKVRDFHGRFKEGLAAKKLYETFDFTFKFPWGNLGVIITLFYSNATDSVWVLVSHQTAR